MEKKIKLENVDLVQLFGINDSNLKTIEKKIDVTFFSRGENLIIQGNEKQCEQSTKILNELTYILKKNGELKVSDLEQVIDIVIINNGEVETVFPKDVKEDIILYTKNGCIKVKNPKQREYLKKVRENDIVFAIGPAGTGKTYLAVAFAIAALKNQEITKIILTRPAVEAGESLGFLPGDLEEKINPYLRPLYDALDDMIPTEKLQNYIEKRIIEVAPLAYMRGRTLNNAFIILDEAQNATSMQMKMCLTRLGINARAIITGDITQIDLPSKTASGLVEIQNILKNIQGIDYVYFDKNDVVRHKLVKDIIDAYEKYISK